jgi:hypothetical protein
MSVVASLKRWALEQLSFPVKEISRYLEFIVWPPEPLILRSLFWRELVHLVVSSTTPEKPRGRAREYKQHLDNSR